MKLLIVDDDPLVCRSLAITLDKEPDIQVLGTAANGAEALQFCHEQQPDMILMDIRMPEMDGIQATGLIRSQYPNIKIVMLTTFQDKPNIQQALQAGAEGYLLKTDKIAGISEKLRLLHKGAVVLDGSVLQQLTKQAPPSVEKLTPREQEVATLVSQGMTNKEIAQQLFLSDGTVRNIISNVMGKLQVTNRTQLSRLMNGESLL